MLEKVDIKMRLFDKDIICVSDQKLSTGFFAKIGNLCRALQGRFIPSRPFLVLGSIFWCAEVRKEARAGEIDAIKKAKAVLSGADYSLLQMSLRNAVFLGRH